MNCREARDCMSDDLDGLLDPERARQLSTHVAACEGCRREQDALRKTVDLLHGLEPVAPPANLLPGIHRALDEKPKRLTFRTFLLLPQTQVALAAGLVLVLGIYGIREVMAPKPVEDVAARQVAPPSVPPPAAPAPAPAVCPPSKVTPDLAKAQDRPAVKELQGADSPRAEVRDESVAAEKSRRMSVRNEVERQEAFVGVGQKSDSKAERGPMPAEPQTVEKGNASKLAVLAPQEIPAATSRSRMARETAARRDAERDELKPGAGEKSKADELTLDAAALKAGAGAPTAGVVWQEGEQKKDAKDVTPGLSVGGNGAPGVAGESAATMIPAPPAPADGTVPMTKPAPASASGVPAADTLGHRAAAADDFVQGRTEGPALKKSATKAPVSPPAVADKAKEEAMKEAETEIADAEKRKSHAAKPAAAGRGDVELTVVLSEPEAALKIIEETIAEGVVDKKALKKEDADKARRESRAKQVAGPGDTISLQIRVPVQTYALLVARLEKVGKVTATAGETSPEGTEKGWYSDSAGAAASGKSGDVTVNVTIRRP